MSYTERLNNAVALIDSLYKELKRVVSIWDTNQKPESYIGTRDFKNAIIIKEKKDNNISLLFLDRELIIIPYIDVYTERIYLTTYEIVINKEIYGDKKLVEYKEMAIKLYSGIADFNGRMPQRGNMRIENHHLQNPNNTLFIEYFNELVQHLYPRNNEILISWA